MSEGEPPELRGGLRGAPAGADERLGLLEREVREQEGLLAGYQQENRRLYDDMRSLQKTSKLTEENMFKENQKLVTEITNLRYPLRSVLLSCLIMFDMHSVNHCMLLLYTGSH